MNAGSGLVLPEEGKAPKKDELDLSFMIWAPKSPADIQEERNESSSGADDDVADLVRNELRGKSLLPLPAEMFQDETFTTSMTLAEMKDKVADCLSIEIFRRVHEGCRVEENMDPVEAEVGMFLYALKDLEHDNATLRGSFGLRELHSNLMPGRWLEDKSEGGGLPANATASAAAEVDNMGRNSMTLKEAKVIHTNSQNSFKINI